MNSRFAQMPAAMTTPECKAVLEALRAENGEARFVGGCVRDALLNRPVTDIDMACTHVPERAAALLEARGIAVIPTGLAHGTVTAFIGKQPFEITTLRRDRDCDGRHAQVVFTDNWREDAARRDFTMNALYADAQGNLFDYFNGAEDARRGVVRFIGDAKARIREDALRILRFFRFFAHYGTPPFDAAAVEACAANASLLQNLSGERIRSEMLKLLAAPHPAKVLRVMAEKGVLHQTGFLLQPPCITVLDRMAEVETQSGKPCDPLLRLALLLRCAEQVDSLLPRWKFSNRDASRLRHLIGGDALATDEAAIKRRIRQYGVTLFCDKVMLAWAEYGRNHSEADAKRLFAPLLEFAESWTLPTFPLRGKDLIAIGIPPSRKLGDTLRLLEQWWEAENYLPNAQQLLEKAKIMHTWK